MGDFVHLHCHTEYSLLDGAIRLDALCEKACAHGMHASAITDHGNLYGAMHFYITCKKYGIKPIIGCEVYVAPDLTDKTSPSARTRYHLILLAQNMVGYQNLLKIVSHAALYGFHYKPRTDRKFLKKHHEGLIALSACYAGEVPRALQNGGIDAGIAMAKEYAQIFPDRFYLEVQSNGLEEQMTLNEQLYEVAEYTGLPLVATNDCHYLNANDAEAHDVLLCVQTQAYVNDPERMRFDTKELFYKTPEEMKADFSDKPEVLANSVRIAEACNVEFSFGQHHFPIYTLSEGMTPEEELRKLSYAGLEARLHHKQGCDRAIYEKRIAEELDIICNMGFAGYFLIVQDFINWAKSQDIPVGPGRGSAAGSVVAWALRITNIDPIPYNLLFERFLNVERVSLPDIDVDFCERRRGEVIEYVTQKYGVDSVAQITTFGKMKAKAAIKDIGRAMGIPFTKMNRIAKYIPNEINITIEKALATQEELQKIYEEEPEIRAVIDIAIKLEGMSRHASTHAAGIVISDKPMQEYLPLYRGKKDEIVTQYDMKIVEKIGLVKFDFLGLRTMTVIQDTLHIIKEQGMEPPDLDTLPLDDEKTYALYASGLTDGVFQVESSGMRQYLRMLRPTCFEDIIAMLALYRPGPLKSGMVDEFISRKHGKLDSRAPLPQLEACLQETYGVIVYQEQVMQIAQIVANYTLGNADLLRRAMGKKDREEMQRQRDTFLTGARENGIQEEKAKEIFELIEKFAEYGFNKSHSAAYALISYYTAYLRAHYPVEFMAALFSSDMENQSKIQQYITQCRADNIVILPPCVNASEPCFSVENGAIRYALGAIKNIGIEAINEIIAVRKERPFSSLYDMCVRVNLRKVTRRVVEYLIKAGACDSFGATRPELWHALEYVFTKAQKKQKEQEEQVSLWSCVNREEDTTLAGVGIPYDTHTIQRLAEQEYTLFEKEALGFFLTEHPLSVFEREYTRLKLDTFASCAANDASKTSVKFGVVISNIKEIVTKKGDKMAFLSLDDLTGSAEAVLFPAEYAKYAQFLELFVPIVVEGTVKFDEDAEQDNTKPQVYISTIQLFSEVSKESEDLPIEIHFASSISAQQIASLANILERHAGNTKVRLNVHVQNPALQCAYTLAQAVEPSPSFFTELRHWDKETNIEKLYATQ